MDQYAILLDGESYIIGISYFAPTATIPKTWLQINKIQYDDTLTYMTPWSKFVAGKVYNGAVEEETYTHNKAVADIRQEMKDLQAEIELNTYLGESTNTLSADLATKKTEYEALIAP